MTHKTTRILTTLTTTLILTLAIANASANRLSITSSRLWRVTWTSLRIRNSSNSSTVLCPVTLEGSFHSATLVKTLNSLVGYVKRASVNNTACTGGHATLDQASLPWHIRYRGYSGVLPNITLIIDSLVGVRFTIETGGRHHLQRHKHRQQPPHRQADPHQRRRHRIHPRTQRQDTARRRLLRHRLRHLRRTKPDTHRRGRRHRLDNHHPNINNTQLHFGGRQPVAPLYVSAPDCWRDSVRPVTSRGPPRWRSPRRGPALPPVPYPPWRDLWLDARLLGQPVTRGAWSTWRTLPFWAM